MNFLKKFLGSTPTDEVALIPSGRLFLSRSPQSPKGELECLYNDAFASIRQTTTSHYYQLCVTRVYQEGELDAHGSSGFDDSDDSEDSDHDTPHSINDVESRIGHSKDEWSFAILEELKLHAYDKPDGNRALVWTDLNGDLGDKFEFIIDEDIKLNEFDSFMLALYKCSYELKYHKSSVGITSMDKLQEFVYNPKSEILGFDNFRGGLCDYEDYEEEASGDEYQSASSVDEFYDAESAAAMSTKSKTRNANVAAVPALIPKVESNKENLSKGNVVYECSEFELHLFDSDSGVFKLQLPKARATLEILEMGDWKYAISFSSDSKEKAINFDCGINPDMNPTFNFEFLSFVFNYFVNKSETETLAYSWLLRFPDFNKLLEFQENFMKAMWETLNKIKWSKSDTTDQNYVLDAFSKLAVDDEDLTEDDKSAR